MLTQQRREQIDTFMARIEEARTRRDVDPRVRRALERATEKMVGYLDTVFRLAEATADYYGSESGFIKPGGGTPEDANFAIVNRLERRGNRLERNGALDRYLRRDVSRDLDQLTNHIARITERNMEALYGNIRKRTKLTAEQVTDIRRRQESGESDASIATEHGVAQGTIRSIRTGRTWR